MVRPRRRAWSIKIRASCARGLLDLDAGDAPICPEIDLSTYFLLGDIIRPGDAVVLRCTYPVLATKTTHIGTGCKQPRTDGYPSVYPVALLKHPLRKILTGGPGGGHAVGQENNASVVDLLRPALVQQVVVVMRMKIEHAGQNRHFGVEFDHFGVFLMSFLQCMSNCGKFSVPDNDARVGNPFSTYPVKQPAAGNDRLALNLLGPLCGGTIGEKARKCECSSYCR